MSAPADPPPLGHLVAGLQAQAESVSSMTQVLTVTLRDILPAHLVQVDYDRSMADKLARRSGTPRALTVSDGDQRLVLEGGAGSTRTLIVHEVRGIALSRTEVGISEWIQALAALLQRRAGEDAAARAALERLLLT